MIAQTTLTTQLLTTMNSPILNEDSIYSDAIAAIDEDIANVWNIVEQYENDIAVQEITSPRSILSEFEMSALSDTFGALQTRPWSVSSQIFCLDTAEELAELTECIICFESDTKVLNMVETNCNHSFCHGCITKHMDNPKFDTCPPNCPMCRGTLTLLTTKDVEILTDLEQRYERKTPYVPEEEDDEEYFYNVTFDSSLFGDDSHYVLRTAERRIVHTPPRRLVTRGPPEYLRSLNR